MQTLQRTYFGMSDAVHSNSNLSLAGLAAAKVAAAIGRAKRGEQLSDDDIAQIVQVSQTLAKYGNVFAGTPYLSVAAGLQPIDTLAEIAVKSGQHDTSRDAEERFNELSRELVSIAHKELVSVRQLEDIHAYFRSLSKTISRMLTTSGERNNDKSFR